MGVSDVLGAGKCRGRIYGHAIQAGPAGAKGTHRRVPWGRRVTPDQAWPGITLVELALVVALLGALLAIGVPWYNDYRDKARNAKAAADIVIIQFDLNFYASANNGQLPTSLDALGRGTIRDPWGNPYGYLNFATVTGTGKMRKDRFLVPINSTYDLYSMGKDGKTATPLTSKNSRDDIIRANNGGFIGLASDY